MDILANLSQGQKNTKNKMNKINPRATTQTLEASVNVLNVKIHASTTDRNKELTFVPDCMSSTAGNASLC